MEVLTVLRRLAEQHDYSSLYAACLESDAGLPAVQVLMALAQVRLGDAPGGRRTLSGFPPGALDGAARVDLAGVYIALGDLDEAIRVLQEVRHDPALADSTAGALRLARLAWCRRQQGQDDDALRLYEESLAVSPHLAVYQSLLVLYRDSGRLDQMAACLDAAGCFWSQEQQQWPDDQRRHHNRQLRSLRLDLWLARNRRESAEHWIERQRRDLDQYDWSNLLCDWAQRLCARDEHAQAEDWLRTGLRHYPGSSELLSQLAEVVQMQGRFRQAIALLNRAIRLGAPGTPSDKLWTRMSAIALQLNLRLARLAAERARDSLADDADGTEPDEFSERGAGVELALAAVEAREDNHTAAEARYRRLIERQQHFVPALEGLGRLYLQLGRIDDAVTLFEAIKTADPGRGYGALMYAHRFPDDEGTLHRLEQFARRPGQEGSVHTGLLFQLAAAWEKRADHAKAFALADEANTATRQLLRYDPAVHRQHCARIRHAFPKALYEHRRDSALDTTLPVFVVGMPRSGTSLVEQILAGHSRIHGAGELGTFPQVIAGLERWERRTGSGRRFPDCVDDLDTAVLRGIAENILADLREYAPEAAHIVDKLPHNFENVGLIRLLFPRAKIISVRRDPRDIAISNYFTDYAARHSGMGFAYDLDWIGEQLADHNLLMHHWRQLFPDILEVHYEALVGDPESGARRMLNYIGVDWEPQVLDFHTLQRPVKTASLWQVRQPLYSTSKARWLNYRRGLEPLVAATNREIRWEPIEMVTLPEPGWLNLGVDQYRKGEFDAAEYRFKQLLHHVPGHAAANFMLGLIYIHKGYLDDGIPLMEEALLRCPWNPEWRRDLAQAYRRDGREADAAALFRDSEALGQHADSLDAGRAVLQPHDFLFMSEESG